VRFTFEINVSLLSTAYNSVPVSPGGGDGFKADRNGSIPQGFAEMTPLCHGRRQQDGTGQHPVPYVLPPAAPHQSS